MCAQISDLLPFIPDKDKDNPSNFLDNLNKYLFHWPIFLISLIITFTCAFFYLQIAKLTYDVKATLLIKDLTKAPEEKQSSLSELDITNSPKLSESEIEVLKSRKLIDHVVSDLQLWVTYQKKDGLKTEDLYKSGPVTFKLIDSVKGVDNDEVFDVIIKDAQSFLLRKSNGQLVEFHYKNTLVNDFGTWKLEPTSDLNRFKGAEIKVILQNPKIIAEDYQKDIDASLINKLAPAIGLSLKETVQQRGIDILNDLIRNYNLNSLEEKNRIAQSTLDFIDKRIGSISDELGSSEKDLEKYRSSNGLTNISLQSQVYLQNVQANDKELNRVNVELNVIGGIESYINSSQGNKNSPALLDINEPSLNSAVEKLSELQLQRDKLLATVPENNPIFDSINRQIATIKTNIKEIIQNLKSSLLTAKSKLQSFNSKFDSSIRGIPEQERNLIDKTRQQSIKENLYTYLLQKKEEASMHYASTLDDVQIVDNAYVSNLKTSKTLPTYGYAFLLGLLLPIGLIYSRSSLSNRITNGKEIEKITGESIFGELSYAKSSSGIIVNDRKNIVLAEELRALRTNLHFLKTNKDKGMVILLTSSIPNEGKSFIGSNLGLVLAATGKKTIVLEMDLRKPKISAIFNLSLITPGISDYLTGQATKESIIQRSEVHNSLDVIGSGPVVDDPTEILGLNEIDSLVEWLKTAYDYIIIDTPPISLVTDAKMLSRVGDITLYIVRQAYTYKSLLPFIKTLINEQKFPEMKFIFNAVKKGKYGYGYNYDSSYYQGAGGKKATKVWAFSNFSKRF